MDVVLKRKNGSAKIPPQKSQILQQWKQAFLESGADAKLDPNAYSGWEVRKNAV